MIDYTKVCFVIMPFGTKPVGTTPASTTAAGATPAGGTSPAGPRNVDFDAIYDRVFLPAVAATPLPEGGFLQPRRTDKDFFSGSISEEMFQYLEYSRIALADISGLNANVMYEIGARHRARESGTVIFRQVDTPIPFDINQIKAFPYEYEPEAHAELSRREITRLLTESLQQNRLDSPIQLTLARQRRDEQGIETLLRQAEDAIRYNDRAAAEARYAEAATLAPNNPLVRMQHGLLAKQDGRWSDALADFVQAIAVRSDYSEAWRERGIAEEKLYRAGKFDHSGEQSLRRALTLNAKDFDAAASLGGVLKRDKQYDEAYAAYHQSAEVSHGHTYPLLNALTLRAFIDGRLTIDAATRRQLERAERSLRPQVAKEPPYNAPWSAFDLAQIRLFLGDATQFLELLDRGVDVSTHDWQPDTFRQTLQLLADAHVSLDGLEEGIDRLRQRGEAMKT